MPTASKTGGLSVGRAGADLLPVGFRGVLSVVGLTFWLAIVLPLAGCGESGGTVEPSAPAGPHGGPLVELPGEAGVAEVLMESATTTKGSSGGKERVVVYFLSRDRQSPSPTLPTDVSVLLRFPDAESIEVPLSPDPKKGESIGAGRFTSKAGSYAVDRPIGELSATFEGQPFRGAFAASR